MMTQPHQHQPYYHQQMHPHHAPYRPPGFPHPHQGMGPPQANFMQHHHQQQQQQQQPFGYPPVKIEPKLEPKQEIKEEEPEDDTPLDEAQMEKLKANLKPEAPPCDCFKDKGQ